MTQIQASTLDEPFLAVLGIYSNSQIHQFLRQSSSLRRWTVGAVERLHKAWKPPKAARSLESLRG
jgi:hypothetical protein